MTTQNEMTGKVVLITGATNGIGKATAHALAGMGATLIIVGRDAGRAQATVSELKARSGNQHISALLADFTSLAQVRQLAKEFRAQHARLDVLINNAGAIFDQREATQDGFEKTIGVNHLAPFLLTNLLLDLLISSGPARIVNVASAAHMFAKIAFDDLQSIRNYGAWSAYNQSKLANVLFTYELARVLTGTRVTANALHPGGVSTGFGKASGGVTGAMLRMFSTVAISAEQGAQTSIYLASSLEVEKVSGRYFDKCTSVPSSKRSYDLAHARRLWDVSAQLTGLAG